jgi:hypothetical protein
MLAGLGQRLVRFILINDISLLCLSRRANQVVLLLHLLRTFLSIGGNSQGVLLISRQPAGPADCGYIDLVDLFGPVCLTMWRTLGRNVSDRVLGTVIFFWGQSDRLSSITGPDDAFASRYDVWASKS